MTERDERPSSDPFHGWEPAPDSLVMARGPTLPPGPELVDRASRSMGRALRGTPGHHDERGDSLGFALHFDPHPGSRDAVPTHSGRPTKGAEVGSAPDFPWPGDVVSGFRIVSEIGRGAFARVYLAEQVELAGRRVALKVSLPHGEEPQVLARLQHAHIVPIHSAHDDPELGLRLICMPYLGGANLAQVLDAAEASLPTQATGRSLIKALDMVGGPMADVVVSHRPGSAASDAPNEPAPRQRPSPSVARSALRRYMARLPWWSGMERQRPFANDGPPEEKTHPARRYYRNASYLQAVVWIGARLAEALEHAHGRGLLHRDLKPSNVLIAGDGTPMLLDFNLSAEVRRPGTDGVTTAEVGGTLHYMSPEHLDAFDPEGSTAPEEVDERSDLYALGLILFEMVTGRHAFRAPPPNWPLSETIDVLITERRRGAPSARRCNEAVPWSLDAILAMCLHPLPGRRYQHASDLAEDLRRFLDDQPLAFARDVSIRERTAKWARRHPRASSSATVGGLAGVLLLLLAGAAAVAARSHETAKAQMRWNEFLHRARNAEVLSNTRSGPTEHLAAGVAEARAALGLFHIIPGPPWPEGVELRGLDAAECRELRRRVPDLLVELLRAEHKMARNRQDEATRAKVVSRGVEWLNWAEALTSEPSRALLGLRAEFETALGQASRADADRARANALPIKTARDRLAWGSDLLARGRDQEAEPWLAQAAAEDPSNYWVWFNLGLCRSNLGKHLEAACHYATCTALRPDFSWGYVNQGMELARLGRLAEALGAYNQALAANPEFRDAFFNRGLLFLELDQPERAEWDLTRARKLGLHTPAVLAGIAEAIDRQGRHDEAERLFTEALARYPRDPIVLLGRATLLLGRDPDRARADLDRALVLEPRLARAHLGLAQLVRGASPTQALEHLDRALSDDPDLLDAVELRALVRAREGDRAALDDVQRLVARPNARRYYNAACAVALLARSDQSLVARARDLLEEAIRAGHPRAGADEDPDLDAIRPKP